MTADAAAAAPVAPSPSSPRDRLRFRFRKDGALRWLSHHDLMRTVERMLRRAEIPFCSTQGFNPHPRLSFALSLPLGVIGCEEVLELEVQPGLSLEVITDRLARQCPPGLTLLSLRRIEGRRPAQVRRLSYRLRVPAERCAGLEPKIAEVLAAGECWVERHRPTPRRVNLRPLLDGLELIVGPEGTDLEMTFWLRPEGTARPEEVLTLLGLADLVPAGVVLQRSRLELQDEVNSSLASLSPEGRGGKVTEPVETPREGYA